MVHDTTATKSQTTRDNATMFMNYVFIVQAIVGILFALFVIFRGNGIGVWELVVMHILAVGGLCTVCLWRLTQRVAMLEVRIENLKGDSDAPKERSAELLTDHLKM